MSLSARLFLLVLLTIAPLVTIEAYNDLQLRRANEAEVHRTALSRARAVNEQLQQATNGVRQLLVAIAAAHVVRDMEAAACETYLREVQRQAAASWNLAVADAHGRLVCSAIPMSMPVEVGDRVHVQRALQVDNFAVGVVERDALLEGQVMPFAYPVHGDDGLTRGVAIASMPLGELAWQLVANPLPPQSDITVLDRQGLIAAQLPQSDRLGRPATGQLNRLLVANQAGTARWVSEFDGIDRIVGFVPVTDAPEGMLVTVGLARDVMMRPFNEAALRGAYVLAFGIALSFVAAGVIARRAIRAPVAQLDRAVHRWQAGELGARTGLRDRSELGRLGRAFDAMADALERRERERAHDEAELRRSRDEAARANASKSQFLAAVGHDLRQPLQSLELTVAVLAARLKSDADRPLLERMRRGVSSLASMLNSLLDVSQVDAGLVTPQWSDFALTELLDGLRAEFQAAAEGKRLVLEVVDCGAWVRSDRNQLGRMLRNLVSNAVKYTDAGGVVRVSCDELVDRVRIAIVDNGIGVPPERQREIFQEFVQLDNPERDRAKGLGLGLAIVDRLSRLLDHPVEMTSAPGRGSTFAVTVPRARSRPVGRPPAVAAPVRVRGRVLLVDDDPLVAEAVSALLQEWGADVECAGSVAAALTVLEAPGEPIDFVISDYRLPSGTGMDVLRAARRLHPAARVALISADAGAIPVARAEGVRVLRKPIRARDFAALLS